jgi:3-dehydroquinate dehydratase-2
MTQRLLVLHGPDLLRLGDGPLRAEPSLDQLDAALDFAATAAGAEVHFARGTEAELVRAVDAAAGWATHAVVSPGALAPTAWLLRAALAHLAVPFAEVFVEALPDSDEHRKRSVLEPRAEVRKRGPASEVYAEAAEKLLGTRFAAVPAGIAAKAMTLARASPPGLKPPPGRAPAAAPGPAPAAPPPPLPPPVAKLELGRAAAKPARNEVRPGSQKTIGRKEKAARPEPGRGVTRAQVRQQIADRLAGRISAAQLATWGREQWFSVERGGPTEAGQRELLQEVLQSLALSTAPGLAMSEPELLDWMARMG